MGNIEGQGRRAWELDVKAEVLEVKGYGLYGEAIPFPFSPGEEGGHRMKG